MKPEKNRVAIRGVIWDIDGTLLDSNDAHAQAFGEAFLSEGIQLPYESIRKKIGMGGDHLFPALLDLPEDAPLCKRIGELKKKIFFAKYFHQLKPFPKAQELLHALFDKGLKFAVGTSASKEECDQFLKHLGIADLMDEKVTADDITHSKPDADIVLECLKRLRLTPEEVIMVGDTPYDIEAAEKVGVRTVAFRSGGWGDSDLEKSLVIYDGPADFLAAISPNP